jgi:hypothetical protein
MKNNLYNFPTVKNTVGPQIRIWKTLQGYKVRFPSGSLGYFETYALMKNEI